MATELAPQGNVVPKSPNVNLENGKMFWLTPNIEIFVGQKICLTFRVYLLELRLNVLEVNDDPPEDLVVVDGVADDAVGDLLGRTAVGRPAALVLVHGLNLEGMDEIIIVFFIVNQINNSFIVSYRH